MPVHQWPNPAPHADGTRRMKPASVLLCLLSTAGVVVGGCIFLESRQDREEMKRNMEDLGLAEWADRPADIYIYHVFTGSDSHYYKVALDPAAVRAFVAAVRNGTPRDETSASRGRWGGSSRYNVPVPWWRPDAESDLLSIEVHGGLWHVAASPSSGIAYLERVGH